MEISVTWVNPCQAFLLVARCLEGHYYLNDLSTYNELHLPLVSQWSIKDATSASVRG